MPIRLKDDTGNVGRLGETKAVKGALPPKVERGDMRDARAIAKSGKADNATKNVTKWSPEFRRLMNQKYTLKENEAFDLSGLGLNETLYINAHGNTTSVGNHTPQELADYLESIGLPGQYTGKINLVACNSGGMDGTSFASQFQQAMLAKGWNVKVVGMKGEVHVTEEGKMAVIKPDKSEYHDNLRRDIPAAKSNYQKQKANREKLELEIMTALGPEVGQRFKERVDTLTEGGGMLHRPEYLGKDLLATVRSIVGEKKLKDYFTTKYNENENFRLWNARVKTKKELEDITSKERKQRLQGITEEEALKMEVVRHRRRLSLNSKRLVLDEDEDQEGEGYPQNFKRLKSETPGSNTSNTTG